MPITTTIVFNREIARIFQKKCFQCHTEGNVSMSLTTYKEARPWAVAIKEEILERRMPPWSAVSGYGHFANDISLTGREVSLILSWADGGAPSGVLLADEDKPPVIVPSLTGWEQGPPDASVAVAADQKVAADSPDRASASTWRPASSRRSGCARCSSIPPIAAWFATPPIYEARTGRGSARGRRRARSTRMPAGSGVQLPAAAKLTVEIGYRGNDEDATGARRARPLFRREASGANRRVDRDHAARRHRRRRQDRRARARRNHAEDRDHDVGAVAAGSGAGAKSLEVTAIRPDGSVEPMLWLKNYRADWPSPYVLKEPVTLPAGTRLVVTAYYDNATGRRAAGREAVAVALTARPPSRPPATPAP